MSVHYVDSSAWVKLVVDEPESQALVRWVDERLTAGDHLVSSHVLVTELHRAARRAGASATAVSAALSVLGLSLPSPATYRTAGLMPGSIRSLDALHVATAVELGADSFVTFDERQGAAAQGAGIPIGGPSPTSIS